MFQTVIQFCDLTRGTVIDIRYLDSEPVFVWGPHLTRGGRLAWCALVCPDDDDDESIS